MTPFSGNRTVEVSSPVVPHLPRTPGAAQDRAPARAAERPPDRVSLAGCGEGLLCLCCWGLPAESCAQGGQVARCEGCEVFHFPPVLSQS